MADLQNTIFIDTTLTNASFNNADLTGAQLRGEALSDTSGAGADLTQANLSATTIGNAIMTGATLRQTNLRNATFDVDNFTEANLEGAFAVGPAFSSAIFSQTNNDFGGTGQSRLTNVTIGPRRVFLVVVSTFGSGVPLGNFNLTMTQ